MRAVRLAAEEKEKEKEEPAIQEPKEKVLETEVKDEMEEGAILEQQEKEEREKEKTKEEGQAGQEEGGEGGEGNGAEAGADAEVEREGEGKRRVEGDVDEPGFKGGLVSGRGCRHSASTS